ncbi:hypothetical protein RQP46_002210 [Phenoliferia psychrophenolica]
MGNGKKNKIGGGPKQRGRLVTALAGSLSATAARQRALIAQQSAEDRVKSSALNAATGGGKRRRKMVEREKQRAMEGVKRTQEANDDDEDEEDEEDVEMAAEEGKAVVEKKRERKRGTNPYKVGDKILLIGEGNFSFAHSLLLSTPPTVSPHLVLATSYDTLEVAMDKYPDLMEHVDAIKAAGMRVMFGVDATNLGKYREVKSASGNGWDKVAFNFPHVGLGITDQDRNVRANQALILKFLRSIAPYLATGATSTIAQIKKKIIPIGKRPPSTKANSKRPKKPESDDEDEDVVVEDGPIGSDPEDEPLAFLQPTAGTARVQVAGTVLITLRTDAPYSLWHVQALATRGPLLAPSILPRPLPSTPQPTYRVVRSFEFDARDWEGYEHRRTVGFKEGVSSGANEDLLLSARERGEKRTEGKSEKAEKREEGEKRREDKERKDREKSGREKKGAVRTWELEWVADKDEDDAYD